MIALLGMALFAVGISRIRSAKGDGSVITGIYAVIVGVIVTIVGYLV